ncbi:MAG: SAM-dependent chlorinase/fluorinase [Proteobacteria bacterium]|nr:SAM-dependent chlorinase/fluorinase [Pseudomonadota bacterium]MBU1737256.1 SAM-dependent chlorinase/fluorinase [Pseudomonadota bacterium]
MITLTTDFGLTSEYVGVMKGVILSRSPHATIVDINHSLAAQDITEAAFLIRSVFSWFPEGSVHVVVVDPGVGSGRRIVLVEAAGHRFLVPDNGVATLLLNELGPVRAYVVSREEYFLEPVSATFHGRDIFAPVAAKLDGGLASSMVGPEIGVAELVSLQDIFPVPDSARGEIRGKVVSVDSFGSLISNISRDNMMDWGYDPADGGLAVGVGGQGIGPLRRAYSDVEKGRLLALLGSRNYLEVAVNGGSAACELKAAKGIKVTVSRS